VLQNSCISCLCHLLRPENIVDSCRSCWQCRLSGGCCSLKISLGCSFCTK
jgi:hypothetical protein